jgi:hypothetical protein
MLNRPLGCDLSVAKKLLRWAWQRRAFVDALVINGTWSENALNAVGQGIKYVIYPNISRSQKVFYPVDIIDRDLRQVCTYCPNVTEFMCNSPCSHEMFEHILQAWPNLRSLSLGFYVDQRFIETLARFSHKLDTLEMYMNASEEATIMNLIVVKGPFLKKLSRTFFTSREMRQHIAAHCPQLRYVQAEHRTIIGLREIVESIPKLVEVSTSFDTASSEGLQVVSALGEHLEKFQVELGGGDCADADMVAMLQRCRNLRILKLSMCHNIATESAIALGQYCHNLRELSLSQCGEVHDEGLAALAAGCPHLEKVDFFHQKAITDIGLTVLLEGCRWITVLNLTGCKGIRDASMLVLPRLCPYMRDLKIEGSGVTKKGVRAIAVGCKKLRFCQIRPLYQKEFHDAVWCAPVQLHRPGLVVISGAELLRA